MKNSIGVLAVLVLGGGIATLALGLGGGPVAEAADAGATKAGGAARAGDIGAAPADGDAQPGGVQVAVLSSLAKVRPTDPVQGASRVELRALRGECESAQIAIRAGAAPLAVVPRLQGSLGPQVDLRLYQVALVDLQHPSGPEGAPGRWPDPLIPAVDVWAGEKRRAFPLEIAPGESRAVLVEACVGAGAKAGARTATIALTFDSGAIDSGPIDSGPIDSGPIDSGPIDSMALDSKALGSKPLDTEALGGKALGSEPRHVPLTLQIESAAIPVTATLPTTFGFSSRRAAFGHHGRAGTEEEIQQLDTLYRKALLRHRLSAHGGTFDPPPFRRLGNGRLALDFTAYDREVGPFLAGEALPSGARATTTELRTHPDLRDAKERIAYWQAIAAHHRAKGWKALLFDYARDEPRREELPEIGERARLVKKADPSIRVLLTASLDPGLVDAIDLWTPNLNCLYVKQKADEWCAWRAPLDAYRKAEAKGALLWWYQSCSSHGCDDSSIVGAKDPAAAYFRGWPSYVVDAAGSRARAMGWLAFAENIGGELYWATVHAYAPDGAPRDPWKPGGLWAFGGNGDGTLFYPGTPARIGGKSHIPVGSLRLQHVRDGLEDYELLRLVAARPGGEAIARAAARKVAPAPYRVTDDPGAVEEARRTLLDFLRTGG